jgi:hypothetical protein
MSQPPLNDDSLRYAERDRTWLERELNAATSATRDLRRRLEKTQQQLAETTRAYNKTVENMLEIIQENNQLTNECERLRWQCQNNVYATEMPSESNGLPRITPAEARAIRKAMARLHHPDVGGSVERMQRWNALLDRIEAGR